MNNVVDNDFIRRNHEMQALKILRANYKEDYENILSECCKEDDEIIEITNALYKKYLDGELSNNLKDNSILKYFILNGNSYSDLIHYRRWISNLLDDNFNDFLWDQIYDIIHDIESNTIISDRMNMEVYHCLKLKELFEGD